MGLLEKAKQRTQTIDETDEEINLDKEKEEKKNQGLLESYHRALGLLPSPSSGGGGRISTFVSPYDPDAQAFIDSYSIAEVYQEPINQLVLNLKGTGGDTTGPGPVEASVHRVRRRQRTCQPRLLEGATGKTER